MDTKEAAKVVRDYFDSVKKIFLFKVKNVYFDTETKTWVVDCDIQNLFDKRVRPHTIGIDDNNNIIYVTAKVKQL